MKNLFKEIAKELISTVENSCDGIIHYLDSFQNEFKFLEKKCQLVTSYKVTVPQPIKVKIQVQVSSGELNKIRPIEQVEPYRHLKELSEILDHVQDLEEPIFKDILEMLKKQNILDLIEFLQKRENLKHMNEEMRRKIQKVTEVLRNLEEHDFNKKRLFLERLRSSKEGHYKENTK
ncbi:unnamed protein product [Paramecium sonneborni]|uniref:Uncharacterized protein n=1 Tax=Paramecium sonneborni TaxID=65129 RepID=A0A8S1RM85_9CILI|nr:unnamed protein product [Paramecium sonneborni]